MKKIFKLVALSIGTLLSGVLGACSHHYDINTDLLIIGGGASGTSAGIQAARMGVNAVIVEESPWLGGMLTAAGVSCIDGNSRMPSGFFGEFRDSIADLYGGYENLMTNWVAAYSFEPSVGNALFHRMVEREKDHLTVIHGARLADLKKLNDGWSAVIVGEDGKETSINAKILIDGTEFGDVAKMAGVGYDLGMENGRITGEDIAPDSAYNIVQDMTFVALLKDYGPDADMTIEMPEGYDPMLFANTCQNDLADPHPDTVKFHTPDYMMCYGKLQNGKYMINWPFAANDYYANIVDMTREERDSVLALAKAHTMKYLYFLQTQLGYKNLALADDEYPTEDRLPFIPYVRESRRIHGKVRFDVNHVKHPFDQADPLYRTGIAVGDYPVDHHHSSYNGPENLPYLYFYKVPSYCLPLGTLIPDEVDDLIVTEKSISVSNIANGCTREQPVVMQIGQTAGALAALAIKNNCDIADVPVREVQNVMLSTGGYIMPYLDVPNTDERFAPYQRVGATGILKGEGKSVAWSNETWLYVDSLLTGEAIEGFYELYPKTKGIVPSEGNLMSGDVLKLLAAAKGCEPAEIATECNLEVDSEALVSRGDFAVMVDRVLDPFNTFAVDHKGHFVLPKD